MSTLADLLRESFWAAGDAVQADPAVHDMQTPYFDRDASMVDASGGGMPDAFWAHMATALRARCTAEFDLSCERRVMTPQGTSRPVRDDEVLGDRLRSLGWWIESRFLSAWKRSDEVAP